MNAVVIRRLLALDRRVLLGLIATLVAFVALEGWLLVLRAPLAEWRALSAKRQASEANSPLAVEPEIRRLSADIERIDKLLQSAGVDGSDDDKVLELIATLSRLGARHGVSLGSVKAGGRRVDNCFERVSFDLEARGAYRALVEWLAAAEDAVAPLSVIELTMNAVDEGRQVALKVKFAAYLPMRKTGTGP